jgi:excisionase family DNA binding protein
MAPKAETLNRPGSIDPDSLYTYEEVADRMSVTAWHVRNMVREGRIVATRVGDVRGRRIRGSDYLAYLASHRDEVR